MSNKRTWLNDVHDAQDSIRECSDELRELANGFRITGNNVVAEQLHGIANDLNKGDKSISDAIGMNLKNQVDAGFNEIGNVLKSVINR